jgi:aspartyl-tRNA(Asn)/glutamyl-tRNA(Gln) amidotransferase subunit B
METYTTTIGLEVHAELKTNTKMFCDCKNDPHSGEANAHICPVCMAHPGTLPVINKEAEKHVLKVGVALGSELAAYTEFDRKNYFYPDIPKGYQISQYLYPLVKGGLLNDIRITRVHLEEDTARSLHDQGEGSIVDYNRAGVPLMELVTEPVIHDAKTAGDFARELQLLLRTLGVSDANMERGEMRVEANISVSKTDTFGTKVEVKNLNSFRSVEGAIEYEVKRHIECLERGEKIIQETRGWDEVKGKTFSQRLKESANDYRYFPDPDLPKLDISKIDELSVSRLKEEIPELPKEKRIKYSNLGLTREQIYIILSNTELTKFFEVCLLSTTPKIEIVRNIGNYLTTDVGALIANGLTLGDCDPRMFTMLMEMIVCGDITSRVAKDLLNNVLLGANPREIAESKGLLQDNSTETIRPVVQAVINDNPAVVSEYRGGKVSVIQFLIGQAMKATKGSANPSVLKDVFEEELADRPLI